MVCLYMPSLWLLLATLLIAGAVGRIVAHRRRQLRTLRDLARRHRLNFSPEDLIGLHERYQNLDLIRRGHNRHAWNVVYGSAEPGLIALFGYSYDLGFGANRTAHQYWIVVIETPRAHHHWQAFSGESACRPVGEPRRIGPFDVWADHPATLSELLDAGLESTFHKAPANYRWEARGTLLAVATPMQPDPQTPEQLLTTACELALRLPTPNTRETMSLS